MAYAMNTKPSTTAPSQPELMQIRDRIDTLSTRMASLHQGVGGFLGRALGGAAEKSAEGPTPVPSGAIASINDALNGLEAIIDEAQKMADRLNQIA